MTEPRLITAAEAALDDLGNVKGPGPVTDGNIALFDGTTGTLLKAAGVVEGVATIDETTNVLVGDGAGNAINSGSAIGDLGSFLSANTARVDPSGNDETGTVGNLTKPFLTVQAAIDAIEAGSFTSPIIDIGCNSFDENVTSSLTDLTVRADRYALNFGFNLSSITLTGTGDPYAICVLINISVSSVDFTGGSGALFLYNCAVFSVTSTAALNIFAPFNSGSVYGSISSTDDLIVLFGLNAASDVPPSYATVDAGNSGISATHCLLDSVVNAGSVDLFDSRLVGETPNPNNVTIIFHDVLLNPALMDFSTLPRSETSISGKAWIDDTDGLNIVKVKLD